MIGYLFDTIIITVENGFPFTTFHISGEHFGQSSKSSTEIFLS